MLVGFTALVDQQFQSFECIVYISLVCILFPTEDGSNAIRVLGDMSKMIVYLNHLDEAVGTVDSEEPFFVLSVFLDDSNTLT